MDTTRSLPSGTVTFLFTDIEGSTRLWEQHPEAMEAALARHDALAAALIAEHHGLLVKHRGEGDSLFAVFPRAAEAVAAATALQQALCHESWPPEAPLRVRMALHTGDAVVREDDYYGAAVSRCARLRAIAYGGQVLLSLPIEEIVRDALPERVALRDLGNHRLKDLQRPEHVFQLVHPSLPAEFPPLQTLDLLPNNLPQQLTSFIGREKEIAEVKQFLGSTRLLALTGAGGTGKTRLALQVAADVLEHYSEGVWLVELAALADPARVPQAVASVLDVREEPGRSLIDILVDALKPKRLLLVLDNCEHLLSDCAKLAEGLLRACPHVRILATSREALGVAGERTYRVPSLSQPDLRHLPPVEADRVFALTQYEAVRLFIERAVFSNPGFVVTNQNASAVAQICTRLDGIPLAMELAAARVKALPVEKLAERLDDRFRLLTGGSRTALPRQQTLRALIDWSYDLLSEPERALLRRLSVFAGGWTLEAAEAVCAFGARIEGLGLSVESESVASTLDPQSSTLPLEEWEVLDLLGALVEKSLVQYEEPQGEGWYRLLETVRQYSRDRLLEAGEAERVRGRHLEFFVSVAEQAEAECIGPAQRAWLERLEREHDNLRAALEWAEERGETEAGLRLAGALWGFWHLRDYNSEGRERLVGLLARAGTPRTTVWAKAQACAGFLAHWQGDDAAGRALSEESLALGRALGDKWIIAFSLRTLARVAKAAGEASVARSFYEEARVTWRALGNRWGVATSLSGLAIVASTEGDWAAARPLFEEELAIRRELGDRQGIAAALNGLGDIARRQGDFTLARSLIEEALAIRRELGIKLATTFSLSSLGRVAEDQGDHATAQALYEEWLAIGRELGHRAAIARALHALGRVAWKQVDRRRASDLWCGSLTLFQDHGDGGGTAACLESLAALAGEQGQPERAARLFGAAEALRQAMSAPLSPVDVPEYDRSVTSVRIAMGEEAFASAWAEGRAMARDAALAYALERPDAGTPAQ